MVEPAVVLPVGVGTAGAVGTAGSVEVASGAVVLEMSAESTELADDCCRRFSPRSSLVPSTDGWSWKPRPCAEAGSSTSKEGRACAVSVLNHRVRVGAKCTGLGILFPVFTVVKTSTLDSEQTILSLFVDTWRPPSLTRWTNRREKMSLRSGNSLSFGWCGVVVW